MTCADPSERQKPLPIEPLPLWQGDSKALTQALKQAKRLITSSGLPGGSSDDLYSHQNCRSPAGPSKVLSHQAILCPATAVLPLLLKTADGWQLIAIQSLGTGGERSLSRR